MNAYYTQILRELPGQIFRAVDRWVQLLAIVVFLGFLFIPEVGERVARLDFPGETRFLALVPVLVLVLYGLATANYQRVLALEASRDAFQEKVADLQREVDSVIWRTAPHLRWQTPTVSYGGIPAISFGGADERRKFRVGVLLTNVGGQTARIRRVSASSSRGDTLKVHDVGEPSDLYAGVEHRIMFNILSEPGQAFELGPRTITWSVCYSDQENKGYDTVASVDVNFPVDGGSPQVTRFTSDESTPQEQSDKHSRHG